MSRPHPRRRGSLTVVGTGIKLVAHVSLETVEALKRAEKVFFLVTEPATEAWIRQLNAASESLEDLYEEGKSRYATYEEMSDRIYATVRRGVDVCAAFYGHPGVLVTAAHKAIERARAAGHSARMLPAISSEDCLFAELGVNPGDNGCQSFEATDFLASRRRFDPTSELILFQAGVLGEPSVRKGGKCRPERLDVLMRALRRHYPARHPIFVYEASPFPTVASAVTKITVGRLPMFDMPAMATLYIPARPQRPQLKRIVKWFDMP